MRVIRKSDLSEDNPLSTDLEWMLQSRQARHDLLVEALVAEYYTPLYQLAINLMDDPTCAAGAVQEAITQAVLHAGRYQPPLNPEAWLYREALEVFWRIQASLRTRRFWKVVLPIRKHPSDFGASQPSSELDSALWLAVDGLDRTARIAVLLTYVHDWPVEKIAAVLRIRAEEVKIRLEEAWRSLLSAAHGAGRAANALPTEDLEAALCASLKGRWPEAALPPLELHLIVKGIQSRVEKRDSRRRKAVSLNEVALVGVFGLLVVALMWGSSLLLPEPAPRPAPAGRTAAKPSVTAAARAAVTATPTQARKSPAVRNASTPSATRIPSRRMN